LFGIKNLISAAFLINKEEKRMHALARGYSAKGLAISIALFSLHSLAVSQTTNGQQQERRIYQADSVGNVRYHAPSWTVQSDGRVIETNRYGEKMHHKQQYKVVGEQVIPVDSVGNQQPHKGASIRR
jgi:hypothetical protein